MTIDHVKPKSIDAFRTWDIHDFQVLCHTHNREKGALAFKPGEEYYRGSAVGQSPWDWATGGGRM